ncbi:hypothetical protein [Lapidilactobacillus achengensis]|uniref:hypothetical protein n=1 Tax=Lapidilactobacillus achengensis TaxID=2486000 RepID=UPI000F785D78|nr:hypothetical protein [Lapidilactobacillus achengensis]
MQLSYLDRLWVFRWRPLFEARCLITGASFEANPQAQRLVFKSSLILSDKSLRIISPLSHTS